MAKIPMVNFAWGSHACSCLSHSLHHTKAVSSWSQLHTGHRHPPQPLPPRSSPMLKGNPTAPSSKQLKDQIPETAADNMASFQINTHTTGAHKVEQPELSPSRSGEQIFHHLLPHSCEGAIFQGVLLHKLRAFFILVRFPALLEQGL